MKKYQSYKKTGLKWLDEVPSHWETSYSKWLFGDRKEKARDNDEQLTASQKYGVIPQSEFMDIEQQSVTQVMLNPEILKHVEPGDFVISMRSFQGGIEYCEHRGCVSSAYVPLYAKKEIHPAYYRYLFKSKPYIQALQATSNLVRDGQALRFNNFIQVDLPVPPISEQVAIGKFLDSEVRRLNEIMIEKKRLLGLLKEKRYSLVKSAIDDPGTKHVRIGYAAQQVFRPIDRKDQELYEPIGLYNRGRGIFKKEKTKGVDLGDSSFFYIEEGDLVLSGQFAWEGAVAIVTKDFEGCVSSHRYPVLRGSEGELNTKFLWAFLSTRDGDFILNENSRGSAGRNRPLNIGSLLKEKIPIPSMKLQRRIANHVDLEIKLFQEILQSEKIMEEHKQALVSSAVTGKIDVRSYKDLAA